MESIRQQLRWRATTLALGVLATGGTSHLSGCALPGVRPLPPQLIARDSLRFRPIPAPRFGGRPITAVTRREIIEYADGLTFASDPALSDSQPLLFPPNPGGGQLPIVGPWAKNEAEIGLPSLSRADLAAGRIIARISSDGDYFDLGLARGVHYVWVERAASGRWTAYMIPRDGARQMTPLTFTIHPYDEAARSPAFRYLPAAKWFYTRNPGSAGWWNCGDCCAACDASYFHCQHW
jgi:hypothetical protein